MLYQRLALALPGLKERREQSRVDATRWHRPYRCGRGREQTRRRVGWHRCMQDSQWVEERITRAAAVQGMAY
jgi:hypothetical protein